MNKPVPLLLLLAMFIISCKKSNQPLPVKSPIINKWYLQKIISQYYRPSGTGPGDNVSTDYGYNTDTNTYIQFNSNGTGSDLYHRYDFKYIVSGSQLTITKIGSTEPVIDTIITLNRQNLTLHTSNSYNFGMQPYRDVNDYYYVMDKSSL